MLQVTNIQSSYRRVPAIRDVSLTLNRGEVVAIVGGNGNGKSTTLRAIAGLNALDGGRVVVDPVQRVWIRPQAEHGFIVCVRSRR